jgi:hypothetical protein
MTAKADEQALRLGATPKPSTHPGLGTTRPPKEAAGEILPSGGSIRSG